MNTFNQKIDLIQVVDGMLVGYCDAAYAQYMMQDTTLFDASDTAYCTQTGDGAPKIPCRVVPVGAPRYSNESDARSGWTPGLVPDGAGGWMAYDKQPVMTTVEQSAELDAIRTGNAPEANPVANKPKLI